MKEEEIIILGAGVSGLSASYFLRENGLSSKIYEKNDTYGGLCNSFEIDGFIFDTFAHLLFSKDAYVNSLCEENTNYIIHPPEALNYYHGQWIRNPVQNNIFALDLKNRIDVIKGFIEREQKNEFENYEDWLRAQYGNYFAEHFPMEYTKKYWTVEACELETKWIKSRMYTPTIDEILEGAMSENTPCVHYSKEMHYPLKGGFKKFLKPLINNADIIYNCEVISIEPKDKIITFENGQEIKYKSLISTLPLNEMGYIIKDIPSEINNACEKLDYTSGVIISLGFNRPNISPALWFYIYDEDIHPARVYSPSKKSVNNVPKGCSSMQAEIYFSKYRPLSDNLDIILEQTINQLIKMKLFKLEDIIVKDIRVIKYANIIFTPQIYKSRELIHHYLRLNNIYYAGRFGEWDYLWADQSILSGKNVAQTFLKESKR